MFKGMSKSNSGAPKARFEPGKLIVQFKPHVTAQDCQTVHSNAGAVLHQEMPELNIHVVSVDSGKEIECKKIYMNSAYVVNVDLNYYFYDDFKPNDPFYNKRTETSSGLQKQWGLRRIEPEPAWDIVKKLSSTVKIAIIDTGIDPNHPDLALADKIVDPANFSSADINDFIDQHGHGTHVAGIAAAITNNKTGVAGTSFNTAFIMPVRSSNEQGIFTLLSLLNSILYAIEKEANVINMSLGGVDYVHSVQMALDLAWDRGIVNIASAGNLGREQVPYPGGYNHVLAVAATDQSNGTAYFSNWGVFVGIVSPGVDILSATPTYPVFIDSLLNYDTLSGTSMSAPFVSGVAAMIMAVNPDLTNQEIVQIIQQTASSIDFSDLDEEDNEDKTWSPIFGYGLLNAGRAVKYAKHRDKCKEGLGSFYGQVVNKETGLPVISAVFAVVEGEPKREYDTKINISAIGTDDVMTDGMFRLMNLPKGTYDIFVILPGENPQFIQTATIVPGSDVFLRLPV